MVKNEHLTSEVFNSNHNSSSIKNFQIAVCEFSVAFSSPSDEPDDRNCDSPREVRKTVTSDGSCIEINKINSEYEQN